MTSILIAHLKNIARLSLSADCKYLGNRGLDKPWWQLGDTRGGLGCRGGSNYNGGRQTYNKQREYDLDYMPNAPPSFSRYNNGASNNCGA